jgi:hypothetical protein
MLHFTYEDDIEIKNKHVAGISITFYLPMERISRPPQSRETIPLRGALCLTEADAVCRLNYIKMYTKIQCSSTLTTPPREIGLCTRI